MSNASWPHHAQVSADSSRTAANWMRAIRAACRQLTIANSYSPSVYGHSLDWSITDSENPTRSSSFDLAPKDWTDELREDLAQDVFLCLETGRLIGTSFGKIVDQIQNLPETNPDQDQQQKFQTIVKSCVHRVLLRRARRTDLARLKKRFSEILVESKDQIGNVQSHHFTTRGTEVFGDLGSSKIAELDQRDLAVAVFVVKGFPIETEVVSSNERQKAPRIFSTARTREIIDQVILRLGKGITATFLDQVIEHAFAYLADSTDAREISRKSLAVEDPSIHLGEEQVDHKIDWANVVLIVSEFLEKTSPRDQAILLALLGKWGKCNHAQIAEAMNPPLTRQRVEQIRDTLSSKFRSLVRSNHQYLDSASEDQERLQNFVVAALYQQLDKADLSAFINESGLS